jgi:hypothetical protein
MYTKKCTKCGQDKSVDQFYKDSKNKSKLRSKCKRCFDIQSNEIESRRRKVDFEYKERLAKRHRERRAKDVEGLLKKQARHNTLIRNYGIGLKEYEQLFKEQNGRCKICDISQELLNKPLCVDHCHSTGIIRGLLCSKCNTAIGFLQDNSLIIDKASAYVRKYERS